MYFHRVIVAAALCLLFVGASLAETTVGTLEPATGTWRAYRGTGFTTLVCSNSSEAAMLTCIAADAERRTTTTRYQLRYPNRYVTATYAAPPPPPPPPPPSGWTLCAMEYQTCTFTGTRRARFGLNTSWVERDLTGPIACRINTFGSDPVPGAAKRCELRNVDTPPPPPEPTVPRACSSRVCDVSWTPNGPADGFRVFYSRTDGTWANAPVQVAGSVSRTNVTMPETGIWYFAVKSFIGGTESEISNVVVRDVQ